MSGLPQRSRRTRLYFAGGRESIPATDPPTVDDDRRQRTSAPEVTLAHELVHCVHALAGTMDSMGRDTAGRRWIRQAATMEAVGLFREK